MTLFSGISDAMESLSKIVSSFTDSVLLAFGGPNVFKNGHRAKVNHGETDIFYGHICERLTSETVTLTRENDGVLVHVPRNAVVWTAARGNSDD